MLHDRLETQCAYGGEEVDIGTQALSKETPYDASKPCKLSFALLAASSGHLPTAMAPRPGTMALAALVKRPTLCTFLYPPSAVATAVRHASRAAIKTPRSAMVSPRRLRQQEIQRNEMPNDIGIVQGAQSIPIFRDPAADSAVGHQARSLCRRARTCPSGRASRGFGRGSSGTG